MDTSPDQPISKSRLKRKLQAVRDLGKVLVELPDKQLAKIPLTAPLREAITGAHTLKRGALQRQIRYIGGLLASESVDSIRQALEETLRPDRDAVERFHQIEKWRDDLLHRGDEAINELLIVAPNADRQKLRRLIRTAHQEANIDKPPRSSRQLFDYLRDLLNTIT